MITKLTTKQKIATLAVMGFSSILVYLLLLSSSLLIQMLYLAALSVLFTGDRPTLCYAAFNTIPRDLSAILRFFKLNVMLFAWEHRNKTVVRIFQETVAKHPDKVALIMDDFRMTFHDAEVFSNRIANYFKQNGFKRGDSIALFMENKPEYSCVWLGLSKVGIVCALVNNNLRKDVLIHSIKAANSKAIIFGIEMNDAIREIVEMDHEIRNLPLYHHVDQTQKPVAANFLGVNLNSGLLDQSALPPHEDIALGQFKDKLTYIYTSGTTGMPKAAIITNSRYMFMVMGSRLMLSVRPDDIIYNALPLYHTAAGILGIGNVILGGSTMAMRRKFSASNFWSDCIKYNCTVAQYIGEICRYLLAAPPKPHDTQHRVRLMFGNGLREQIWKQFVSRFNIHHIGEVYGSTEGNSNLINIDRTVGAVGFVPRWANKIYPVTLVKCDEATGEPIRNSQGRCIRCGPGEPGVFIGKINKRIAVSSFGGYSDKKASEKKIIHDVFKNGDSYFNSGDILVTDLLGYFYFRDRTGDTFRWKGENVATSEVEAVISNIMGLQDCVVYGVEVPHTEGKAGMAAIVVTDSTSFDLTQLANGIRCSLPAYARPLFIRLLKELPMTGTFKMKKNDLVKDGYNLDIVKDPIYFLNSDGSFKPFTRQDAEDLQNGRARL